uniref:Rp1 like 1b n=1 Tax=Poecilia formosa TaxID=48698 RepID=A0A087XVW1_POEFO
MSRHKRNFHCFNAVGGEGSHKSSHPLDHHTTWLPKIPQRGMAAYHELEQECCLCPACRPAHTLDDVENQLLPFYHAHPPYHHHHHPHQYVLSGPSRHEETHSTSDCHLHHQRYNKKIVLVKNSDPSFRKTVILHLRGLRSFGLFLEEVSELMQYHIRKLYTQEGCKIDSVQSLLQCPGVLVCVGREPFHPLVMEDFEKTSSCKLPKLSEQYLDPICDSMSSKASDSLTFGLATKTSIIFPNLGDDKRATKHSVSSDKSVPDGRDSPDFVSSCPPSGNGVREDDIEKRVRVNKDGSLSMEMKVCFRLPNDETLHWSTTVKKTAGRTYDHIKAHNDPNLAQISDANCSESEIMSADEAYFTQHYQGRKEKPHCPYCCSHCQGYETWKNVPGAHGARRCSHTSSSSASSRRVVSRKTVIEKQTMSRSSEELADHVVETCITESIEAAEMVEFCTIQSCHCGQPEGVQIEPKEKNTTKDLEEGWMEKVESSAMSVKSHAAWSSSKLEEIHKVDCSEEERGSKSAMSVNSNASTNCNSAVPDVSTEGFQAGDDKEKKERTPSSLSVKSFKSTKSVKAPPQHQPEEDEDDSELRTQSSLSALSIKSEKSVKSNISAKSNKLNQTKDYYCDITETPDTSEARTSSVASEASAGSKSAIATEQNSCGDDGTSERAGSVRSVKSGKSHTSVASLKSKTSQVSTTHSGNLCDERNDLHATAGRSSCMSGDVADEEQRGPSAMSAKSNVTTESTFSKASGKSNLSKQSDAVVESNISLRSGRTNGSTCTQAADATESFLRDSEEMNPENRAENCTSAKSAESQTVRPASAKSATSTKSKKSTKSTKSNTSNPERALSVLSVRSTKSTISIDSTKSKCSIHDRQEESYSQENDTEQLLERPTSKGSHVSERSVKSAERPCGVLSDKSKVSDVESCASVEISDNVDRENATEQRALSALSTETVRSTTSAKSTKAAEHDELHKNITNNGEMVERAASNMSGRSEKSTTSNISTVSKRSKTKSNKSMHSTRGEEDGTPINKEERRKHGEERPPSSMSAKSIQSCVSEISMKSAGRTPSSAKTSTAEACSGKCPDESNIEEAQARAESVMSSKTERSASSAKSNKSKGLGSGADENKVNDNRHVERSPSNLSVRSEKSTKSNASKGSKRLKVSKICLENEGVNSEEKGNGSEDKPLSPRSVRSNTSIKSNKSKCCTDAKTSDNFNSDIKNDKEVNTERAPSRTSTISIQSSVSEISTKSEERAASGLSEISHASVMSDLKNISEVPSEIHAPPDEVGSEEDEERTSVMSVKSINSSVSDKSTKSAKSNASKRSVKSECERCDDEHEYLERSPSSTSTKSVVSHISKKSAKSANRPPSASSAKSAKSDTSAKTVKSNISDAMSGKTVESQERTNSVLSSKTAKSTTSTKSPKVKEHTSPTEEDDGEHEDRNLSSMSARSVTSAKSNISKVSQESKASAVTCELSAKSGNEDDCQEEHNENRSMSSMSIHSVKSDISARSDTNRTGERTDNKASQDRSESAMSATEVERPASNLSVNSAKSTMSNVTGTSTKSKTSNIPSAHEQEITASDTEEEGNSSSSQLTESNVSGCSKKSRCSDVAAARSIETPSGDNNDETMQDRAESCTSVKTGCSHVSERSTGSKAFSQANEEVDEHKKRKESASNTLPAELAKSLSTESERSVKSSGSNTDGVPDEDYVAESNSIAERAGSRVSDRSAKSKSSTKSKRPTGGDLGKENSKEESLERARSCMSTSSVTESVEQVTSTRSSKPNILRISATASQVSDTTLNDENTNERSSSNISTNVKTSSRVTTPSEVTSVDGTSNGEGKTQRPPSTLSARSAKSSKSSKSTKSSKLQISNKPDDKISVEDMKRTPSKSSIKSTISRHSDGGSNNSEILAISPENVADENTGDTEIKTLSPVSAKSLKTNVSSVSTKSKVSYSQKAKEEDQSQRSHSVLSIKSDTSSRTIQSNGSCITPREEMGMDEDSESTSEAKSTKSDPSEALSRSEVPSVTIEESEDRSPTATSSMSKASGRSKKSRTSEIHGSKSSKKSQSSLSVHSHVSKNATDVTTASVVPENTEESVTPSEVKEGPADKKSSKTNRSREQGKEDAGICLNKHPVICHADSDESDLSQTLSCSDKEICETSSPGKSKSHVSDRIVNGSVEATDTVSDKSDTGSKHKEKNDASDFELVPSILPNTSPTEVVNEWLKTLPTERVLYEMEELNENSDGVKDNVAAEETDTAENAEKNESEAENSKEVNGVDNVQNDCQTCLETPTEGNTCTQREDDSAKFNSSIQVMKVLLNPKLDRCNSLPEISPVYGRKLSTSAQGLLDCLVKLQLIDHDPKNANEKNERYQELMSILQSLWLSNPSEEEHIQNTNDHHSVEGEYNHTSSSGVDVNSGSTGSGKSSDGVKSSNNVNVDGSQPQNSLLEKTYKETDAQWKPETEEVNQEEEDPATDETIRSNDSPREPPETPSSSNKSSGESSSNDENLSKKLSQDSDPVWVLTLLNKIERQFMMHYVGAMKELKVRWSLGDTDQLDTMIDELKTEVHNKIQISINREVRKIQGRAGLPRPPTEATPRTSNKQREERRRGVKLKFQQSMDSQGEKSDSTTGTLYSDQRGENIDEYCPCETCVEQNFNSTPPLSVEVRRTAPVVMDYDLKRILLEKTASDCAAPCRNDDDTMTAETLVEKVIIGAIKEVEINKMQQVGEEAFEFTAGEKEADDACQDDRTTIEESVKVFAVDNEEEETGKAGVERPGSESGAIHAEETASEEVTDDAITPRGQSGFDVNSETAEKDTDMLSSISEDKDKEEVTGAMPVQSKEETEKDVSVDASSSTSSTKLETSQEDEKKDWVKLRRRLLPSVQIIGRMKNKKQSLMTAENNEMVKDQTEEEEESETETDVVQQTITLSENEPLEEIECSETEDKEPAVEVSVAQTSDVKSSEEKNEESFLEEDEKEAMETSSVATSEHNPVAILTDQKSDMEEVGEGTGTTNDQDAAEESGGSSDEDESEDEREATINELSSIQEEETTGDELSITMGYKGTKKNDEAESEVQASEREEFEEDSTVGQEETISPVNSNDSPDESEAAAAESSGESDEGSTTEDETDVKKQTAVTGEDETVIAASPEKANEAGQVNPQEDPDAEVRKGSLTKSEDENEESEIAISEHKSEKDSAEEEGTDTDEEKLPAVSADEFADENGDSSTEDESSEEDNKEATTEDEISTHKEIFPAQNGESKDAIAEEEATAERTENEEAGTVDDEKTGTASESDSAEDINGTTNDDDNAEENDDMSSERSIECAENQTKDEQTGEGATAECTSVHKFEEAEEEEVVDCKEDTDTTEDESGKGEVEETTSRQGSDSVDETNEEKEDKLKEEQSIEATDAEEEDTVKSKSDSVEGNNASSNDETSAAETEHEIDKAYNVANEKEPEQASGGEESDVSSETDPESAIEGSSKAVSENESEAEGSSSAIDDENSANNLKAGKEEKSKEDTTPPEESESVENESDSESKCEDCSEAVTEGQDSVKDSEKEDEDTDTPAEGWSGSLGDSADGEDEAEEDSEPEEDTADGEKPFVADKLGSLDATKKTAKKTLLIPLDALMKERAESEDGAFADIEDSETDMHDQDDVTSLESKSLKK